VVFNIEGQIQAAMQPLLQALQKNTAAINRLNATLASGAVAPPAGDCLDESSAGDGDSAGEEEEPQDGKHIAKQIAARIFWDVAETVKVAGLEELARLHREMQVSRGEDAKRPEDTTSE